MLRDLLFRIRAIVRRRGVEADLDAELQFHRERQLESYARAGLSPAEARRRLAHEFGDLEQTKDACRDARGVSMLEHLWRDVRVGLRGLRRAPGFTAVAVLTLGLGLGANTAIFSVVYGTLLRPLPYADPASLVVLNETTPKVGLVSVSYPNFVDWRSESRAFAGLALVAGTDVDLAGVSRPETVGAAAVSSNYLSLLGLRPVLGRDFTAGEDQPGTPRVALLGQALWHSHFGGDEGIVGRTIAIDGEPATIVGVLPQDLRAPDAPALLLPLGVWLTGNDDALARGNRGDAVVLGRLATGTPLTEARQEMERIAARLASEHPGTNAQFSVALRPLREVLVGDVRPALLVLFGTVLLVLLIACANVANLSLIRGAGRAREMALRVAIGAGRRRLIAQMLVESALVAGLGGAAGLAFAVAGRRALVALLPDGIPGDSAVGLNGPVLAFSALTVLVATVVFGLSPALQAARADVTTDLNEGGRAGGGGRRQQRWRAALTVAEIALALVLLVGAGLMLRSLSRLMAVDPGVRTDHVLTMYLGLPEYRYGSAAARAGFWDRLLAGTAALPGVEQAALGTNVPLTNNHARTDISIEGRTYEAGALPHPDVHIVSPGYFGALGVRVVRGRSFAGTDDERAPRVGLINRAIAERHFGAGVDPVGRRFAFGRVAAGDGRAWMTIVGVVEDTRMYGLDNPSRLEVYLPLAQRVPEEATLVVRTSGEPGAIAASVRGVVAALDRDQPVGDVATLDELRDQSISTRHVTFVLLALFSVLALVLAALGIYGVMAYGVAQRRTELAIRRALGARPSDLLLTVAGRGLAMAGVGIGIGLVLAFGATRLMGSLLFSVDAADPATFAAVAAVVAAVATVACVMPGLNGVGFKS